MDIDDFLNLCREDETGQKLRDAVNAATTVVVAPTGPAPPAAKRSRDEESESESEDERPATARNKKPRRENSTRRAPRDRADAPTSSSSMLPPSTVGLVAPGAAQTLPSDVQKLSEYHFANHFLFTETTTKLIRKYLDGIRDQYLTNVNGNGLTEDETETLTSLFIHQKLVRDFLNMYTPYRGLLLDHALGSGKTATSICITQCLKSDAVVVAFTPNALMTNFEDEVMEYGEQHFRLQQHWVEVDLDGFQQDAHSTEFLLFPEQILEAFRNPNNHAPDFVTKKPFPTPTTLWRIKAQNAQPNFNNLNEKQKNAIRVQVRAMLRFKYRIFSYDAFSANNRNSCLDWMNTQNMENPFDNKIVIIDESHEFVRTLGSQVLRMGKQADNRPFYVRDEKSDPQNFIKMKRRFIYVLYDLICRAQNCRVILLSGSPIMNIAAIELPLTMNMVQGRTVVYEFSSTAYNFVNQTTDVLRNKLLKDALCDYYDFSGTTLTVTRAPQAQMTLDNQPVLVLSEKEFIEKVKSVLQTHFALRDQSQISHRQDSYEVLPSDAEEFKKMFMLNGKLDPAKANLLKRRINGATSYFDVPMTHLMPRKVLKRNPNETFYGLPNRFTDIIEEKVPMSDVQFSSYCDARKWEIDIQTLMKKKRKLGFDEDEGGSAFRSGSRARCNFVFQTKARVDNYNSSSKNKATMKDTAIMKLKKIAVLEMLKADAPTPPSSLPVVQQDDDSSSDEADDSNADRDNGGDDGDENDDENENEAELVANDMQAAGEVEVLLQDAPPKISAYFGMDALKISAPKMHRILTKIQNRDEFKGNHLFFSNFRSFEGINFFSRGLCEIGYVPFKLTRTSDGAFIISEETMKHLKKNKNGGHQFFTYVDYGAVNGKDEKTMLMKLFNSQWRYSKIGSKLKKQLKKVMGYFGIDAEDEADQDDLHYERNSFGKLISVFLISDSGTRGLSLQCVRWIHMLDPSWYMTKLIQVKGRGSRIDSQKRLPEEYRDIAVFVYLSTFTNEQKSNLPPKFREPSDAIVHNGVTHKITTDEYLYYMALRKDIINEEFVDCLRETAIDCALFNREGFKNPNNKRYTCFRQGQNQHLDYATIPDIKKDMLNVKTGGEASKTHKRTRTIGDNGDAARTARRRRLLS